MVTPSFPGISVRHIPLILFMTLNIVHTDFIEKINGCTKTDGIGNRSEFLLQISTAIPSKSNRINRQNQSFRRQIPPAPFFPRFPSYRIIRQFLSVRTFYGRKRRKNRNLNPGHRPVNAACLVHHQRRGVHHVLWAIWAISLIGFTVPSTLETWAMATIFVSICHRRLHIFQSDRTVIL